jgi:hypothetical protein
MHLQACMVDRRRKEFELEHEMHKNLLRALGVKGI